MRARLAIVIAIGTLGSAVAANAQAATPATPVSPDDSATFMSPARQIIFEATVPMTVVPPPPEVDFYASTNPSTNGTTGLLSNYFVAAHGLPTGVPQGDGSADYAGSPDPSASWPTQPDTYYWQAVYFDCTAPTDCIVNASTTRSFTITPRPASSVSVANPPDTFLTDHPRRRVHKRKARFAFSSDVAGAHFQCLYAKGWAACKSPHTFRHLKPGRFRFQARAVVNGVEDPTPASWTFKVLR
ncbi:hypothetical protein [Pengzhenrongella sp.]|jgi:hypothetical protein|uniref:hypothetical protein n=1 Tax=Pengzhenrongella sp. TaxID=2888820 RepID=UPI002F95E8C9